MKPFFVVFFWFCFLCFSFAQDVPFDVDSIIIEYKDYSIIKWSEAEVEKMDSLSKPKFYEGAVLVVSAKEKYIHDTIYVSDVTGVDREKCYVFTVRRPWNFNTRIIAYFGGKYCVNNRNIAASKDVFNINKEAIPVGCSPNEYDFKIDENYIDEFPNGLPQKMSIYSYSYTEIYLISWNEWKLIEKHKTDRNMFGFFVSKDDEGNIYYPIPVGYYSDSNKMDCNSKKEDNDSAISTLQIQEALKKTRL